MVELCRSHERFDQFGPNHSTRVDRIESAFLSPQEVLRRSHVWTAGYVNTPRTSVPSVLLTNVLF